MNTGYLASRQKGGGEGELINPHHCLQLHKVCSLQVHARWGRGAVALSASQIHSTDPSALGTRLQWMEENGHFSYICVVQSESLLHHLTNTPLLPQNVNRTRHPSTLLPTFPYPPPSSQHETLISHP